MQTATQQPATAAPGVTLLPLNRETRTAIPTAEAAYHLNRRPQTLRHWACFENGPIRPIRICGRLAWKVSEIAALLSGEVA